MTRIPISLAGLALVAAAAVACGSDDGDGANASDTPGATTSAATPSTSDSPTASSTPSASDAAGDPVPSPIVNKAVKDALKDDFPALVPAGVPAGWTVTKATYSSKHGGQWWIQLTDPNGADVTLAQSKKPVDGIVSQYLPDAQSAGQVDLSSYGTGKWSSYTGMGAAALAKALSGTSAVVVGPDADTVLTLAQELLTAEDGGTSDGG